MVSFSICLVVQHAVFLNGSYKYRNDQCRKTDYDAVLLLTHVTTLGIAVSVYIDCTH